MELHRSQDEMRPALNALHDTGAKTTGSKELDNAGLARDFDVSGSSDEMTARS